MEQRRPGRSTKDKKRPIFGTPEAAIAEGRAGIASLHHPPAALATNPELETSIAEKLRCSLHLNVALCALKREDYYLAREACKYVLSVHPDEPKALFRLSQALQAQGDHSKAIKTLTSLLRVQPSNREARKLLSELREHLDAQKALFRGVCSKEGFVQPDEEIDPVYGSLTF